MYGAMESQGHHIHTRVKVAATSPKLDIRLHPHQVGTNTRSGTEVIFMLKNLIGSRVKN